MKKVFKIIGLILCVFVVIIGGYAGYVAIQYYRIEDNLALEVNHEASKKEVSVLTKYSVTTYNIGFGAYSPDFDFFMDSGVMKDGTKVTGTRGKAIDKEHVENDLKGAIDTIKEINPTFALFQEVDTKAHRSYKINEYQRIVDNFPSNDHVYAENFHSAYLLYPFNDPHGKVNSGIVTLSQHEIKNATRKSFTVSKGFDKFFDLDRCFSVSEVAVNNGKKLMLVNLHMSAYDEGGVIRAKQMVELSDFLKKMEEEGNYVVAGGDFNHDLLTYNPEYHYDKENFPFKDQTEQVKPDWLAYFFNEDGTSSLPESYKIVASDNVSTCRAAEMPWEEGVNYVTVVDGFIVSNNIEVLSHRNIATGNEDGTISQYAFSDHQPAYMEFILKI